MAFLAHYRIYNLIGILTVLAIAFCMSNNRSKINVKLLISGLLMHIGLAILMLKTSVGQIVIGKAADVFGSLYRAADSAILFMFGNLAQADGAWGFIFAFKVLPVIIFFGAFMSILFHYGIIQRIVSGINLVVRPILGTSGAETLCAIANSFLGQTEAPLLIRHYLKDMTKSEFLVVMISGMGTISGSLLAVFALMGVPAKHLLAASVMAIPATIIIAKIIYPETESSQTMCAIAQDASGGKSTNILDAISQGTTDGLWLALNVGAMLISFLALLTMANSFLLYISGVLGFPAITLTNIFGWLCLPFGWLLGLSGDEAFKAAQLIGTKIAINELVAYDTMLKMGLSERAVAILTYALCGFSNFSCIGIQIGGIGALVPEKKAWLSQLGVKAVFGAALANLLSAFVASLLL